jgi:hypothetical protein
MVMRCIYILHCGLLTGTVKPYVRLHFEECTDESGRIRQGGELMRELKRIRVESQQQFERLEQQRRQERAEETARLEQQRQEEREQLTLQVEGCAS